MDGPYFGRVRALTIDSQHPDTLYVGLVDMGDGGLFKTNNGGEQWNYLPPFQSTYAIVIDPQNSDRVYAGMWRSTDSGVSWVNMEGIGSGIGIRSFAVDPINTNFIYAGGSAQGIWKSIDYGENWEAINNGIPIESIHGTITSIAINPLNSSTLIIGTYRDGMYKSYNGGENWDYIGFTRVKDVVFDGNDTTIVYAVEGSSGSILKSIDSGDNWFSTGLSGMEKIKIDPSNSQILYAAGYGIYKSSNGGSSWSDVGNGFFGWSKYIWAIEINPKNPNEVYIGTEVGVYKSEDEANQWIQRFKGLGKTLNFDFSISGGEFYTAAGFGVFQYTNEEWIHRGLYYPIEVEYSNGSSNVLFATTDTQIMQIFFYRSFNNGLTWENTGLFGIGSLPITVSPSDPNTVYVAGWRSTNQGDTWEQMSTQLDYGPIAVHPEQSETLYMGSYNGVYKSTDSGTTWDTLAFLNSSNHKTVTVDPLNGEVVYVGIYDEGIFKSINGGVEWTPINAGLTNFEITALGIHPVNAQHLYAGTYGGGIFQSKNGGLEWAAINEGLPSLQVTALAVDTHKVYVGFSEWEGIYQRDFVISVQYHQENDQPNAFVLFPNYPNPFNAQTTLQFQISNPGHITLKIYNVLGEEIITIVDKYLNAGYYTVNWDGKDNNYSVASSGMYIYSFTVISMENDMKFQQTRKMVFLR